MSRRYIDYVQWLCTDLIVPSTNRSIDLVRKYIGDLDTKLVALIPSTHVSPFLFDASTVKLQQINLN